VATQRCCKTSLSTPTVHVQELAERLPNLRHSRKILSYKFVLDAQTLRNDFNTCKGACGGPTRRIRGFTRTWSFWSTMTQTGNVHPRLSQHSNPPEARPRPKQHKNEPVPRLRNDFGRCGVEHRTQTWRHRDLTVHGQGHSGAPWCKRCTCKSEQIQHLLH
jgi:hypothetical protein